MFIVDLEGAGGEWSRKPRRSRAGPPMLASGYCYGRGSVIGHNEPFGEDPVL